MVAISQRRKKSKRERQPNARSSIFSMRIRKGPMLGYRRFVVKLSKVLESEVSLSGNPQQYRHTNGITYAAHIFAEAGKPTGKLENILLPLMRQGDEEIFHRAESYVELHDPKRLPRLKVVEMGNGQLTEVRDEKKKGKIPSGQIGYRHSRPVAKLRFHEYRLYQAQ